MIIDEKQVIWQEMNNIFPKEEVSLEAHSMQLGRYIFMYHLENKMVQIPSWLHSTFKELSNDTSHAKIRVKTKKLWPREVGEEKQAAIQKLCRDQGTCVTTKKLCRDQEAVKNKKGQKLNFWPIFKPISP